MAAKHQDSDISPDNKRKYERIRVSRPVKMEATLRGRFIDIMRLEMSGVTIDMSEGGFSANVDQSIAPGARCRVELAGEDGGEPQPLFAGPELVREGLCPHAVAVAIGLGYLNVCRPSIPGKLSDAVLERRTARQSADAGTFQE